MCKLSSPGTLKSEIAQADINQALSPSVQYACKYWVKHAQNATMKLLDKGPVDNFLRRHLLHWVEAMSLMENVSDALLAITDLSTLVQV
jgi:hypothetical protein